jgi:hypothetical protein
MSDFVFARPERPPQLDVVSQTEYPWGSIALSSGVQAVYGIEPVERGSLAFTQDVELRGIPPIDVTLATDQEYGLSLLPGQIAVMLPEATKGRRWPVEVLIGQTAMRNAAEQEFVLHGAQAALAGTLAAGLPPRLNERTTEQLVDKSRKGLITFLGASLGAAALMTAANQGELPTLPGLFSIATLAAALVLGHKHLTRVLRGMPEVRQANAVIGPQLAMLIANDLGATHHTRPPLGRGDGTDVRWV